MSHELRTPITSIQGFADMIAYEEGISEAAREYVSIISNESKRASSLLSNFLSATDLQQKDKEELFISSVKLDDLVEEVLEEMKDKAKKKRIRLIKNTGSSVPPVSADRGLIIKAIYHLVDNAVKYSPKRSSVVVSTIAEDDFIKVEVEDRGYGIAVDEQEKIWQKFYRAVRDGHDKEEESTGLGLSIVKEIIEKHKGNVEVQSKVGLGSKFIIRIPRF
jgi:two-component system phosphate regulon sensor histidine kinase PhoR